MTGGGFIGGGGKVEQFLNGSVQKTPEKISLHTAISYHTKKSLSLKPRESSPPNPPAQITILQPLIYAKSAVRIHCGYLPPRQRDMIQYQIIHNLLLHTLPRHFFSRSC